MLTKNDRSEFVIETKELKSGLKHIVREKNFSNLAAAYVRDLSVHSSTKGARDALSELHS